MRLDKYLSDCGAGTRSEIKKLIRAGAVTVGGLGKVAPDTRLDEASAEVYVNGTRVKYRRFIYLMLNKPDGCISATWDKNRPTVVDFVPEEYAHFEVFPVGRLDIDTVGLCVLTNDGALAHRLLSPARHIPKTYYAEVDGKLTDTDIDAFAEGMVFEDFIAKPARLTIIRADEDKSCAEVVIYEGKFHQIKRMFARVGKTVTYLKRTGMNRLKLDENLSFGEVRELTDSELELLTHEE